ncbi:amino acid ABC transporter ATP-binding protein [Aureimonas populi]|uniref:Amino acid ABC transporter ATP-binding protein n=1 Tax=Aureimonas populi TaxID=1701758 RepID=A0ABW5CKY8_9HYPH|nr:amino acid ABC transporter ATP-binding protein [Aureimonas populi]
MSDSPAVEITKLCKSFDGYEVLRDIDLTVGKGDVVSVLGSSGSGKSTMLRCINWLEVPDSGSIRIGGERIGYNEKARRAMTNREMAAIRARAGMVFQSFNLWPHLNVLHNVMISPVQVKRMPREEARALALSLLEKVGLSEKAEAYPYTLSGGQKQRVAIARALAMSPEVILFDEPTSALDPERVGEVLQVMRNLSGEGYTMIVVTHEMDFARAVSDQVVFLDKGVIVEKAPPETFFTNPSSERVRKFLERVD